MTDKKLLKRFKSNQWFRIGAGAIITNEKGHVLAFERTDVLGAWQLPQGGLDAGEEPQDAVFREVWEETGIKKESLHLLTELYRLLPYELPAEFRLLPNMRGQVQYWFLLKLVDSDEVIGLGDQKEFQAWEWMTMEELIERTVEFRKPVYRELAKFLSEHS